MQNRHLNFIISPHQNRKGQSGIGRHKKGSHGHCLMGAGRRLNPCALELLRSIGYALVGQKYCINIREDHLFVFAFLGQGPKMNFSFHFSGQPQPARRNSPVMDPGPSQPSLAWPKILSVFSFSLHLLNYAYAYTKTKTSILIIVILPSPRRRCVASARQFSQINEKYDPTRATSEFIHESWYHA